MKTLSITIALGLLSAITHASSLPSPQPPFPSGASSTEIHCISVISGPSLHQALEGPSLDGSMQPMQTLTAQDGSLNIHYELSTLTGQPTIQADAGGVRMLASGDTTGVLALQFLGISPEGVSSPLNLGCLKAEQLTIYCSSTTAGLQKYLRCNFGAIRPAAKASCEDPNPFPGPSRPPPGPIGPPQGC